MFKYSIKSLLSKKTVSILFVISICIALSISMLSINISAQIEEGFYQVDKKYDIIIGPKGSSTQLVMSSLFFSDDTLGTIDRNYLDSIKEKYEVTNIVPLAMADSYKGNRIVGTTTDLLNDYRLKSGKLFKEDYEVVVGYNIANMYSLSIGDKLITSHGTSNYAEKHESSPYILVGILDKTNTAYDNTLFTSIDSVWNAHDDHTHENEDKSQNEENNGHLEDEEHLDEESEDSMGYTSILIKTGNLATANKIETSLSEDVNIQAVNTTKILRKLVGNIDMSKQVALLLCGIIVVLASLLTCIMSFLMLINCKKDIKLLKFLGMKNSKIYKYVVGQVIILIGISITISLLINRIALTLVNNISSSLGIVLDLTKAYPKEFYIIFVYVGVIILSTVIYSYIRVKKEK